MMENIIINLNKAKLKSSMKMESYFKGILKLDKNMDRLNLFSMDYKYFKDCIKMIKLMDKVI